MIANLFYWQRYPDLQDLRAAMKVASPGAAPCWRWSARGKTATCRPADPSCRQADRANRPRQHPISRPSRRVRCVTKEVNQTRAPGRGNFSGSPWPCKHCWPRWYGGTTWKKTKKNVTNVLEEIGPQTVIKQSLNAELYHRKNMYSPVFCHFCIIITEDK